MEQQISPEESILNVGIQVEKSIDGVEMGILKNEMPYLTQGGLARITDTSQSTISDLTKEWEEKYSDPVIGKGRNGFLKKYLFNYGYQDNSLFMSININGSIHYAYPEIVCMAVLEYYAFEALNHSPVAIKNYRGLARFGLQNFIYKALKYTPADKWKYYNDRVSILKDSVPLGYFSVFRENKWSYSRSDNF